jgi:hypothetical protein
LKNDFNNIPGKYFVKSKNEEKKSALEMPCVSAPHQAGEWALSEKADQVGIGVRRQILVDFYHCSQLQNS